MISPDAVPMTEAIRRMDSRSPVRAALSSAEWARVPLALRERAQFSAHVESARLLSAIQQRLKEAAAQIRTARASGAEGLIDREEFILQTRRIALAEGLQDLVDPAQRGGLQDITSVRRLGLIFDVQTEQAAGFARWKADQDPDVLDAFPAQELYRSEDRREPRDWRSRWEAAGGPVFGGRMIALKSDSVWQQISRFGTPYPPYDFGSGMWVRDVSRDEAEALGLIAPGERPVPSEVDFNNELQASARGLSPDFATALKNVFGGQVELAGNTIQWSGRPAA